MAFGIRCLRRCVSKGHERTQEGLLGAAEVALKVYDIPLALRSLAAARRDDGQCSSTLKARRLQLETVLAIKLGRGNHAMDLQTEMLHLVGSKSLLQDPIALANLGTIFSINHDHTRARKVLERVPRSHAVWADQAASWYSEACMMQHDYSAALPVIAAVCEDPHVSERHRKDDPSLWVKNRQLWGATLVALGVTDKAIEVLEKTVELADRGSPGPDDVITNRARCWLGVALHQKTQSGGNVRKRAIECLSVGVEHLTAHFDPDVHPDDGLSRSLELLRTLHAEDDDPSRAAAAAMTLVRLKETQIRLLNDASSRERYQAAVDDIVEASSTAALLCIEARDGAGALRMVDKFANVLPTLAANIEEQAKNLL